MAYTSAPESQTYSSSRIPLCYSIDLRPGSRFATSSSTSDYINEDAGMCNLLPFGKEQDPSKWQAIPRPGISSVKITASLSNPRGCYVWEKTSTNRYYFAVFGDKVSTSTTGEWNTWTEVLTLSSSDVTVPVGFVEFIDSTNTKYLVLVDGVNGYRWTDNATYTQITDPDFPTPHLPFPIFLDGYLFLAKKDTGDIYNSNLNDPTTWTAGDYISSELYPDNLTALAKVDNYLLAIGTQGSEYFFDAANATGSPLARQPGGNLPFGTIFPYSVATNKNTVMFLANFNDGEPSLVVIEGFKHKTVGTQFFGDLINRRVLTTSSLTKRVRGFFLRLFGELYYIFQMSSPIPGGYDNTASTPTLAFNLQRDFWTELRTGPDSNNKLAPFPVYSTCGGVSNQAFFVQGMYYDTTSFNRICFFGALETYGSQTIRGQDFIYSYGSISYGTEIRTPLLTFDTLNRKFMSRFGVHSSLPIPSTSTEYRMTIAYTDNDYLTWSSPLARTINSNWNNDSGQFPFVTQLGNFRSRAFQIKSHPLSGSPLITFHFAEVDINKGQQ